MTTIITKPFHLVLHLYPIIAKVKPYSLIYINYDTQFTIINNAG